METACSFGKLLTLCGKAKDQCVCVCVCVCVCARAQHSLSTLSKTNTHSCQKVWNYMGGFDYSFTFGIRVLEQSI